MFCGLATAVASAASFTMGRDAAFHGEDAVRTENRNENMVEYRHQNDSA